MEQCKNFNVPFKNQSLQTLCREVQESFHTKGTKKYLRRYVNKTQRDNIIKKQGFVCGICAQRTEKYEIDHIVPLSAGGDNEVTNLQALCKPRHEERSAKESAEDYLI